MPLPPSRRVNVIYANNGQGLTRDAEILLMVLRELGCRVTLTAKSPMKPPNQARFVPERATYEARRLRDFFRAHGTRTRWDLNIFLESVDPDYLSLARANWFVPNQEWLTEQNRSRLRAVDLVLFKTQHGQQQLREYAAKSLFVGFTSQDRAMAGQKDWRHMLHVAGWNPYKGTGRLLQLWQRHPDWPQLTVVAQGHTVSRATNILVEGRRLQDIRLRQLQNLCGIHVAPSEVEGFGHTLVEAMSCGAVVVTTNAPPMNEVVGASGAYLVEFESSEAMASGRRYQFSESSLCAVLETVRGLGPAEYRELGALARDAYESGRRRFTERLRDVLHSL